MDLPDVIKEEIKQYFEHKARISNLELIEVCEEMKDHLLDIPSIKEKPTFDDVRRFIRENYNNKLMYHNEGMIDGLRSRRRSAGLVIKSVNGKILCVVNRNNKITLPSGKEGWNDLKNLKLTALREAGEELNIWLDEKDFIETNEYFEVQRGQHKVRFYIINGSFEETKIDTSYCRLGEVKKLKWLDPEKDKDKISFPNMDDLTNHLHRDDNLTSPNSNMTEEEIYKHYSKMESNEKDYKKRKQRILTENVYNDVLAKFTASADFI